MDVRDELWNQVYDTYYECFFQELFGDYLVSRWRSIDDVTKILVALTATGSVASVWALWETNVGKVVWAAIAGFASFVSIIHSALGVPSKLSNWVETKQIFTALRIDLETMRHNMAMDPGFDYEAYARLYNEMRERYRDGMTRIQNDWFRTYRRAVAIQEKQLNPRFLTASKECGNSQGQDDAD